MGVSHARLERCNWEGKTDVSAGATTPVTGFAVVDYKPTAPADTPNLTEGRSCPFQHNGLPREHTQGPELTSAALPAAKLVSRKTGGKAERRSKG